MATTANRRLGVMSRTPSAYMIDKKGGDQLL
jgi:hypothetical protein